MGPYCEFCDRRCFVQRRLPRTSKTVLMATCHAGMQHDQKITGYDQTTAWMPSDPGPRYGQSITSGLGGGCYS